MTFAMNLSKRTEDIIFLIMDEEITLGGKKGRCWSVPKINAREKTAQDLAAED